MLMILKVRKDFMLIVKLFTVVYVLYAQSNVYHYTEKLPRLLCHCFVNSGFPRKTNFAYK